MEDEIKVIHVARKVNDAPKKWPRNVQAILSTVAKAAINKTAKEGAIDVKVQPSEDNPDDKQTPPSSPLSSLASPLSIRTMPSAAPTQADPEHITSSFSSNSSKRVIVNGVKAVTNSDSESDDLAPVSSFLPRKKMRMTPPPDSIPVAQSKVLKSRNKSPPRKVYKHSLASLVQQKQADEARATRLRQAEDAVNAAAAEQAKEEYAAKMLEHDENSGRVMAAINRAEVFEQSDVFYFFHGDGLITLDDHQWPENETLPFRLLQQDDHQLLFESGAMEDAAKHLSTSTGKYLASAMKDASALQHEYLAAAIAALRNAEHCTTPLLRDSHHTSLADFEYQPQIPSSLNSSLKLLGASATHLMTSGNLRTALIDLFLANIDENIRHCITAQQAVERCLQLLLSNISDQPMYQDVIDDIVHGEGHRLLRDRQMASAIIAMPATTPELHRFRRQLALQFLLRAKGEMLDPNCGTTGLRLLGMLQDGYAALQISPTTNWKMFYLTVRLLDVAIDAGFSDFAFLTQFQSEAEKLFNNRVDDLSKRLRLIASNIRDSGASQLTRSEAKAALDHLVLRLESTVRTVPKKKTSLFGESESAVLEKKKFLDFFAPRMEDDLLTV